MKKLYLTLASLSLLTLASCESLTSSSTSSSSTITITDMVNREVTVDTNNVDRVACIGAGALRLYSYVGDMSLLCGVEEIEKTDNTFNGVIRPYREINKEFLSTLPSCGKGGPQNQYAEKENILACNPSIVISEYEDSESMNELSDALGIPVVVVSYGTKQAIDEKITTSLTLLGQIFNKEERAQELVTYINGMKQELSEKTKDISDEDKKSVYLGCLGNYGVQDIYSSCAQYSLFTLSNIKNVLDIDGASGYQTVDKEKFQVLDADIIIIDAAGMEKFKVTYQEDPDLFDNLKAFKNGDVYLQMPYNAYYTNIEIAYMDAYYDAMIAYPEVFSDLDIVEKSNEITKMFLGVEYYSTIASWSYGGFQKVDMKALLEA